MTLLSSRDIGRIFDFTDPKYSDTLGQFRWYCLLHLPRTSSHQRLELTFAKRPNETPSGRTSHARDHQELCRDRELLPGYFQAPVRFKVLLKLRQPLVEVTLLDHLELADRAKVLQRAWRRQSASALCGREVPQLVLQFQSYQGTNPTMRRSGGVKMKFPADNMTAIKARSLLKSSMM